LMEKPQNCLFELRQSGSSRDDASSEPECRAQAEATAIRNHHKVFNLIDQASAALAIAVKGMMDLLDVTPDQRELRLDRIRHLTVICRRHRPSRIPAIFRGLVCREYGHVSARGSSSPSNDPDAARSEAQCFGFATNLYAALPSRFISRDDLTRNVGVIVRADDLPAPFVFGAVPGFEFHCEIPMKVHARFARVASGAAGATKVRTSPALNAVAELIVNVAVVAAGAKTMVPTFVLFFRMMNVVVAVAAVAAVPRLPASPAGRVAEAVNT
jgi:hypothetical protein